MYEYDYLFDADFCNDMRDVRDYRLKITVEKLVEKNDLEISRKFIEEFINA